MTERALSAVPDDEVADPSVDYERPVTHGIPTFEGKEVEYTAAKITSVGGLEIDDSVWRVDEYVRMVVECRVVAVDHKVNEKTGKLGRVHLLKAIDSKVIAWEDPV